jgi:hypothetical protein
MASPTSHVIPRMGARGPRRRSARAHFVRASVSLCSMKIGRLSILSANKTASHSSDDEYGNLDHLDASAADAPLEQRMEAQDDTQCISNVQGRLTGACPAEPGHPSLNACRSARMLESFKCNASCSWLSMYHLRTQVGRCNPRSACCCLLSDLPPSGMVCIPSLGRRSQNTFCSILAAIQSRSIHGLVTVKPNGYPC